MREQGRFAYALGLSSQALQIQAGMMEWGNAANFIVYQELYTNYEKSQAPTMMAPDIIDLGGVAVIPVPLPQHFFASPKCPQQVATTGVRQGGKRERER